MSESENISVPKLRFKDQNGKEFPQWERKKLGEVCEKKSSNISANSLLGNNGEYKIYGATGLLKKVNFYKEEREYISIVKDGAGVGRLLLCDAKSSILGTLDTILNKKNTSLHFLYYLLNTIDFSKFIIGSTIPHIYFKDYSKMAISLPTLAEQKKISDFLSGLDNKLDIVDYQIRQTELWKKGIMQKMFV